MPAKHSKLLPFRDQKTKISCLSLSHKQINGMAAFGAKKKTILVERIRCTKSS